METLRYFILKATGDVLHLIVRIESEYEFKIDLMGKEFWAGLEVERESEALTIEIEPAFLQLTIFNYSGKDNQDQIDDFLDTIKILLTSKGSLVLAE